jgi:trans-2,3-dihydro-3-hydroxyanthranilate isomerase
MADAFLEYDVVDVFAETPFAGNQLAVVHGAGDLPDEALAALAREFNYSETTFPTPLGGGRYRNRIFTVGGELPFAGHPTLGTAWVLRERGALRADAVVQECGAGDIGVRFGDGIVELTATPRDLAGPVDEVAVAALLAEFGLEPSDSAGDAWVAGTGLSFVYLPVHADAVTRALPGRHAIREIATLPETLDPLEGVNLYAVRPGAGAVEVHSRVFVVDAGVAEDPATGSAAAGLGIALNARGLLDDAGRYRISQGREIGRPSVLSGRVEADASAVTRVHVAGAVHPIARGQIRVPTELLSV